MKKIVLSILAIIFTTTVFSQINKKKDIPDVVIVNFQKQYPEVKEIKWEKEGENFEAEFNTNGLEESVLYDVEGNLIETEVQIKTGELPKGATDYITEHYKGKKIKEASRVTKADGNLSYEAEINGIELVFDSNGGLIKENKD